MTEKFVSCELPGCAEPAEYLARQEVKDAFRDEWTQVSAGLACEDCKDALAEYRTVQVKALDGYPVKSKTRGDGR